MAEVTDSSSVSPMMVGGGSIGVAPFPLHEEGNECKAASHLAPKGGRGQ
jgi:hypothetical protein